MITITIAIIYYCWKKSEVSLLLCGNRTQHNNWSSY